MRDFNILDNIIQKMRLKRIEKYVPSGSIVLDIGCGLFPHTLNNIKDKIKYGVGLDKIIDTLESKSLPSNIKVKQYTISKTLPFNDAEFDVLILSAILEHLDHPIDILKECHRVLRQNGKIIINIPTRLSKPILEILAQLKIVSREEIFDHKYYFKNSELLDIMRDIGFKINKASTYNLKMNLTVIAIK